LIVEDSNVESDARCEVTREFLERSRHHLLRDFFPKIEKSLTRLSDEEVWWRANEESNSIGNLVLHLTGNVRQWMVSGIGGAPDHRVRQAEFDERTVIPKAELLSRLKVALEDVDAVLSRIGEDELTRMWHIQGDDVSGLEAIYHVVEHFSMHTGQILMISKMRTGGAT
jgi:uncharacterized damage-inducible protein DinB